MDADPTHREQIQLPEGQLGEILRRHDLFRNSRPGGRRAVLTGVDLSGLDLAGQDLSHADFTSASFYGANLAGCRFDCATLFACDFRQANLENASLVRADLRGCHFAGAILVGANLFSADLREGLHVSRDRKGEFHTLVPEEHNATAISGADFSGANLTNASLSGAIAIQTDFSNATMRGCKLSAPGSRAPTFPVATWRDADFGQADTRGACFRGAVLAGATSPTPTSPAPTCGTRYPTRRAAGWSPNWRWGWRSCCAGTSHSSAATAPRARCSTSAASTCAAACRWPAPA